MGGRASAIAGAIGAIFLSIGLAEAVVVASCGALALAVDAGLTALTGAVLGAGGAVFAFVRVASVVATRVLVATGSGFDIAYSRRASTILRTADTVFIEIAVVVSTDSVVGAVTSGSLASVVAAVLNFFFWCSAAIEPEHMAANARLFGFGFAVANDAEASLFVARVVCWAHIVAQAIAETLVGFAVLPCRAVQIDKALGRARAA